MNEDRYEEGYQDATEEILNEIITRLNLWQPASLTYKSVRHHVEALEDLQQGINTLMRKRANGK
jgi:hypothetical protein